ncbi:Cupin 2 conserved barrel domain protein [Oscillochloris trichoides DG-6]|uniref:Cupin 2 conserved barrel domain protein n=1 Tax=Oscillochloris trichoides DG-6 TaxID=765420 RepID=E1IDX8_9CHLR|nr:cupin domain-containing protein [Oscillochloris trichoides]EFO80589.1 Cupin 2 conserved barrel domain protein [Oscillochloris trichoides DG-6]
MRGPSEKWIEVFPGVERHRLAVSEHLYQMEVRIAQGSSVPLHQHPQEQTTYVVRGRLRVQVGEDVFEAGPGSLARFPSNVPHAVWGLEESLVLDTFAPPRVDYLAADGD